MQVPGVIGLEERVERDVVLEQSIAGNADDVEARRHQLAGRHQSGRSPVPVEVELAPDCRGEVDERSPARVVLGLQASQVGLASPSEKLQARAISESVPTEGSTCS